jgi:hypothetical protein
MLATSAGSGPGRSAHLPDGEKAGASAIVYWWRVQGRTVSDQSVTSGTGKVTAILASGT